MSNTPTEPHPSDSRLHFAPGVWVSRSDLTFVFSRSRGPGGQAVNKISSKAQLRVPLTAIHGLDDAAAARLRHLAGQRLTFADELLLEASTFRSQHDNRHACLDRLTALVQAALKKLKVRKKKKPTRAMIERRLTSKRKSSEKKSQRRSRKNPDW